jgi:hypothetical protein
VVLLDVVELTVPGAPTRLLSFQLSRGEILALLVAENVDHRSLVGTLSNGPRATPTDPSLASEDLLVLDDDADIFRDGQQRSGWAKLAAKRADGAGIVLATRQVDRAYRADRVVLAGWSFEALLGKLEVLIREMRPLLAELLNARPGGRSDRRSLVNMLRRFTHASSDLLREAHRQAQSKTAQLQVAQIAAERAGVALGDAILDAIANEDTDA